jgi:hypothetical protein
MQRPERLHSRFAPSCAALEDSAYGLTPATASRHPSGVEAPPDSLRRIPIHADVYIIADGQPVGVLIAFYGSQPPHQCRGGGRQEARQRRAPGERDRRGDRPGLRGRPLAGYGLDPASGTVYLLRDKRVIEALRL